MRSRQPLQSHAAMRRRRARAGHLDPQPRTKCLTRAKQKVRGPCPCAQLGFINSQLDSGYIVR